MTFSSVTVINKSKIQLKPEKPLVQDICYIKITKIKIYYAYKLNV